MQFFHLLLNKNTAQIGNVFFSFFPLLLLLFFFTFVNPEIICITKGMFGPKKNEERSLKN